MLRWYCSKASAHKSRYASPASVMEYLRRAGPSLDVSHLLSTAPFFSIRLKVRYIVPGFIASNPKAATCSISSYPYEFHDRSDARITGSNQFLGRASTFGDASPWSSGPWSRLSPMVLPFSVYGVVLTGVAPLLLGQPAVLFKQLRALPGRRYLPDPVGEAPLSVAQLARGVGAPPGPLGANIDR